MADAGGLQSIQFGLPLGTLLRQWRDVRGARRQWIHGGFDRYRRSRLRHPRDRFPGLPRASAELLEHRDQPTLWRHRLP